MDGTQRSMWKRQRMCSLKCIKARVYSNPRIIGIFVNKWLAGLLPTSIHCRRLSVTDSSDQTRRRLRHVTLCFHSQKRVGSLGSASTYNRESTRYIRRFLIPFLVRIHVDVLQFSNCSLRALNCAIYGRGFAYVNDEQTIRGTRRDNRKIVIERAQRRVCSFYPPQDRGESENAANKSKACRHDDRNFYPRWIILRSIIDNFSASINRQAVAVVYDAINIDAVRIASRV